MMPEAGYVLSVRIRSRATTRRQGKTRDGVASVVVVRLSLETTERGSCSRAWTGLGDGGATVPQPPRAGVGRDWYVVRWVGGEWADLSGAAEVGRVLC